MKYTDSFHVENGAFLFFFVKLILFTEILIFLTLFLCNIFYLVDLNTSESGFLESFNLGRYYLFSSLSSFLQPLTLSFVLLSIKILILSIWYFIINVYISFIALEYMLFITLLSLFFIVLQSMEFYLEVFCLYDNILSLNYLSLVSLHYLHVILGMFFSFCFYIFIRL